MTHFREKTGQKAHPWSIFRSRRAIGLLNSRFEPIQSSWEIFNLLRKHWKIKSDSNSRGKIKSPSPHNRRKPQRPAGRDLLAKCPPIDFKVSRKPLFTTAADVPWRDLLMSSMKLKKRPGPSSRPICRLPSAQPLLVRILSAPSGPWLCVCTPTRAEQPPKYKAFSKLVSNWNCSFPIPK